MSQPIPDSPAAPVPQARPVQKQRFNIYTMMLILSFLAIVTACILLYTELQRFGDFRQWWDTSGVRVTSSVWAAPADAAANAIVADQVNV